MIRTAYKLVLRTDQRGIYKSPGMHGMGFPPLYFRVGFFTVDGRGVDLSNDRCSKGINIAGPKWIDSYYRLYFRNEPVIIKVRYGYKGSKYKAPKSWRTSSGKFRAEKVFVVKTMSLSEIRRVKWTNR